MVMLARGWGCHVILLVFVVLILRHVCLAPVTHEIFSLLRTAGQDGLCLRC